MTELKKVSHIVKAILENDPQARNSDSYLYLKVLNHVSEQNDICIDYMTIAQFLQNHRDMGFPGFETVRRARQKAQQHFPELAACEKVETMRDALEEEFRIYARGIQ